MNKLITFIAILAGINFITVNGNCSDKHDNIIEQNNINNNNGVQVNGTIVQIPYNINDDHVDQLNENTIRLLNNIYNNAIKQNNVRIYNNKQSNYSIKTLDEKSRKMIDNIRMIKTNMTK